MTGQTVAMSGGMAFNREFASLMSLNGAIWYSWVGTAAEALQP
jgi:hypothetical protein